MCEFVVVVAQYVGLLHDWEAREFDSVHYRLFDLQNGLATDITDNGSDKPPVYDANNKFLVWANMNDCRQWSEELHKIFFVLWTSYETFDERACAKWIWNSEC